MVYHMGDISKILFWDVLPKDCECSNRLEIEQCESIHVHYRDCRIEFDTDEFLTFCRVLAKSEEKYRNYDRECKEDLFIKLSQELTKVPSHDLGTIRFEHLKDGLIHVHYRNFRIELSPESFQIITKSFANAYSHYTVNSAFEQVGIVPSKPVGEIAVEIEKINPYDQAHMRDPCSPFAFSCRNENETKDHEKGIQLCMALLKSGRKMLPISITTNEYRDIQYSGPLLEGAQFQRLDGFKRFEAHKRLGSKKVTCHLYIGKDAYPGNQRYLPWVLE